MGWLKEAQDILKSKELLEESLNEIISNEDDLSLDSEAEINSFKKVIIHYYENATDREIDKAIEKIKERFDKPYSKKEALNYIKLFLD